MVRPPCMLSTSEPHGIGEIGGETRDSDSVGACETESAQQSTKVFTSYMLLASSKHHTFLQSTWTSGCISWYFSRDCILPCASACCLFSSCSCCSSCWRSTPASAAVTGAACWPQGTEAWDLPACWWTGSPSCALLWVFPPARVHQFYQSEYAPFHCKSALHFGLRILFLTRSKWSPLNTNSKPCRHAYPALRDCQSVLGARVEKTGASGLHVQSVHSRPVTSAQQGHQCLLKDCTDLSYRKHVLPFKFGIESLCWKERWKIGQSAPISLPAAPASLSCSCCSCCSLSCWSCCSLCRWIKATIPEEDSPAISFCCCCCCCCCCGSGPLPCCCCNSRTLCCCSCKAVILSLVAFSICWCCHCMVVYWLPVASLARFSLCCCEGWLTAVWKIWPWLSGRDCSAGPGIGRWGCWGWVAVWRRATLTSGVGMPWFCKAACNTLREKLAVRDERFQKEELVSNS